MDTSEWIALVSSVVAVVALLFTGLQVRLAKRQTELQQQQREDAAQPYVSCQAEGEVLWRSRCLEKQLGLLLGEDAASRAEGVDQGTREEEHGRRLSEMTEGSAAATRSGPDSQKARAPHLE